MGKPSVGMEQENKPVQFEIERFYIKQQSSQTPNAPNVFQLQMDNQDNKPETQVEMKIDSRELGDHRYEVTLGFHITLKIQQQTALRCEVQQVGIFRISECSAEQRQFLLEGYCPGILHPYARKVVADLSWNAGFLPITLPPIDFDQARRQREQNAQNAPQPARIETETVQ